MIIIETVQDLIEVVHRWHENNIWVINQLQDNIEDHATKIAYQNCLNVISELPFDNVVILKEEFEESILQDD